MICGKSACVVLYSGSSAVTPLTPITAYIAAALVIGSDQVATYDGLQIGKPGTHDKALAQLHVKRRRHG